MQPVKKGNQINSLELIACGAEPMDTIKGLPLICLMQ